MKKQLKWILLGLVFIGSSVSQSVYAEEEEKTLEIQSEYGIVIDAYNGDVLYEKQAMEQWYPASITKVLTAIILEEELDDGEVIIASKEASIQEPSNGIFLLKEGEKITKEQALNLLMMISSNDVAHAVGEHIAGDIDSFAKMMNEKAASLGAKNSDFKNASGLPNEFHKTTVYDMAMIGKEVLKYPNIIKAMQTDEFLLKTDQREVSIRKTHAVLENNEFAIGGKTGYTGDAHNSLLEIMKKGDTTIIAVTMKAYGGKKAYQDMTAIADYAFDQIETKQIFQQDQLVYQLENGGEYVDLYAKNDVNISVNGRKTVENRIRLLEKKEFNANDVMGHLEILQDGKVEATFPLYTKKDVRIISEKPLTKMEEIAFTVKESENIPVVVATIFGVPVGVFAILAAVTHVSRKKRRKAYLS